MRVPLEMPTVMECSHMNRRQVLGSMAGTLLSAPWRGAHAAAAEGTKIVLLGTAGGPSPKVSRAAPASMIVAGGALYVVDCGNGVARQIVRSGYQLKALRSIFITHQHSDHNLDYGNLFYLAWSAALREPVNSFGPPPLVEMTKKYFELNSFDINLRIHDEGRPDPAPLLVPHEIVGPGEVFKDENVTVRAVLVDHPPIKVALSYRFDTADRSVVFSGDTRKTDSLIEIARGADVLVCEAQYLPGIRGLAKRLAADPSREQAIYDSISGNALSVEQAGEVAQASGVKTLVLNHFVPGDDSVPEDVWREQASKAFSGEIIVGKDLLKV
jgi:ribonuclease BN (tRNA processing enzyme)